MNDWQPIETAPKDGSRILGAWQDVMSVYHWDTQSFHTRPNPYWARDFHPVYYDRSQQPTHWMPLPDPPRAAGGEPRP